MRLSLSPHGLMGRVTSVLLGALLLELVASLILYEQIDRYTVREDHARRVAELLVVGDRIARISTTTHRRAIVDVLSTRHLMVDLRPSGIPDGSTHDPALARMKSRIVQWEPSLAERRLSLDTAEDARGGRRDLIGSLQLHDRSWLYFRSRDLYGRWPLLNRVLSLAGILAIGVLVSAVLLLRILGAPLRTLVVAANEIGNGRIVTLVENGPRDVRHVARALNEMQARILRLVADRTQALAAVSHDLRTPLARMKLAVSSVEAAEIREQMEGDIDDMEMMLASLLAYLRAEQNPEEVRHIDLASLIQTIVDDANDLGKDVTYSGPDHLLVHARPLGLKRAITNIVDNAVKYGEAARVALEAEGGHVRVRIADQGPGIPPEAQAAVLEPFYRIEESRPRSAGGFGLGLPIAQRLAMNEGGTLSLANAPEGGLVVTLDLPESR